MIHHARLDEMAPRDLYAVLALRVAVFVVEQQCPYPELDGRDPEAEHWWTTADGQVTACLRVLDDGGGVRRVGRVVAAPAVRGTGTAAALFGAALTTMPGPVVLSAQVRSVGFYERFGFVVDGPERDEDGIPHVPMLRVPMADAQEPRASSGGCSPSWSSSSSSAP